MPLTHSYLCLYLAGCRLREMPARRHTKSSDPWPWAVHLWTRNKIPNSNFHSDTALDQALWILQIAFQNFPPRHSETRRQANCSQSERRHHQACSQSQSSNHLHLAGTRSHCTTQLVRQKTVGSQLIAVFNAAHRRFGVRECIPSCCIDQRICRQ